MGKNQKIQDGGGRGGQSLGREFSAGGVVYKGDLWLVRATAPSTLFPKTHWTLPKGLIDEGEFPEGTAVREVGEETGVEAKVVKKIGYAKYIYNHPENGRIFKVVTFYLMEYIRDLPDGHDHETSEVAWLPYEAAYKKLSFPGEKLIFKREKEIPESVDL